VNYVVNPDKLAVRAVGAVTQSDSYGQSPHHHNVVAMPMFDLPEESLDSIPPGIPSE